MKFQIIILAAVMQEVIMAVSNNFYQFHWILSRHKDLT